MIYIKGRLHGYTLVFMFVIMALSVTRAKVTRGYSGYNPVTPKQKAGTFAPAFIV
jgi:hypothetical protein